MSRGAVLVFLAILAVAQSLGQHGRSRLRHGSAPRTWRLHAGKNVTKIPFHPHGLTGTIVVNCTNPETSKVEAVICQGETLTMDVKAGACPTGKAECERVIYTRVACEAPSSKAPEKSNGVPTSAEEEGKMRTLDCIDEPIAGDCQPGRHPVCEYYDEKGEKQVVLPGPDTGVHMKR